MGRYNDGDTVLPCPDGQSFSVCKRKQVATKTYSYVTDGFMDIPRDQVSHYEICFNI